MDKRQFSLIMLVMFVLTFTSQSAWAQQQDSKIRALFVLKFIENVTWPDDRKAVIIGIIGKDEVLGELQTRLQAKNPNGVIVKRISAGEAATCDVVYIPSADNHVISNIASLSKGVLIISESDLSKKGSGISFIEEGGRLTFLVNKSSIESKGLKVSSTLLSLGKQA
jgi:hypothetical protein